MLARTSYIRTAITHAPRPGMTNFEKMSRSSAAGLPPSDTSATVAAPRSTSSPHSARMDSHHGLRAASPPSA